MRTQKLIPDSLKKKKKKARIGLELFCALDSLLSSFVSKYISNLFTWNFLKCLFGFKLIASSTSSNFKWHFLAFDWVLIEAFRLLAAMMRTNAITAHGNFNGIFVYILKQ